MNDRSFHWRIVCTSLRAATQQPTAQPDDAPCVHLSPCLECGAVWLWRGNKFEGSAAHQTNPCETGSRGDRRGPLRRHLSSAPLCRRWLAQHLVAHSKAHVANCLRTTRFLGFEILVSTPAERLPYVRMSPVSTSILLSSPSQKTTAAKKEARCGRQVDSSLAPRRPSS